MPINIELEPAVINKQSILIKNVALAASVKNSKEITLETVKPAKINGLVISLEAIQGNAKK